MNRYLPVGFLNITEDDEAMTFYIGDADFSIVKNTGKIFGSGTSVNEGRKWLISGINANKPHTASSAGKIPPGK